MDTILKLIISKGHYSAKKVAEVTVLIIYMLPDAALFLYKVHENILDGIKVIEQTRFS